jgi:Plavaka transposase
MSTSNINAILDLWAESMSDLGGNSPMRTHRELHALIDLSTLGDVPWQCMVASPSEDDNDDVPDWMCAKYEVWYHNPDTVVSQILANPEFDGQFDLRPYIDLDDHGQRQWSNIMSGNIAWRHSVSSHIIVSSGNIY